MSEKTPAAAPESPTPMPAPIQRGQIGLNVTLQILLGLILFGLVNYVGFRYFYQWDKTYNREFTLTQDTLSFLKQLDKKISLTVIAKKDTPEYKDLTQLAETYRREEKTKLKIDIVDPVKDPDAYTKITQEADRLHIKLDLGFFVRAVFSSSDTSERPARPNAQAAQFIRQEELFIYTKDVNQRQVVSGFSGEASLTAAMMAVARGEQPIIYVIGGKGKPRTTNQGNAIYTIVDMLARQNIKIQPLQLDSIDSIPEDANALFFIGIETDLNPREVAMIRDYWHGKRHALYFMLNCKSGLTTPLLDKFLAENGVAPQQDRILRTYSTVTGTEKLFDNSTTFLDGSPITLNQKGSVTTIPGMTRSLKLLPESEKPRTENIELKPLLSPTDGSWGEMKYEDAAPVADADDNQPPLYTAASLERGASKDTQISVDSSRIIVISNASLLDPDYLLPQNYDFVSSCFSWLLQRESYIGINPKPRSMFTIPITEAQKGRIFLLTCVVLPLAVFFVGILVWGARRG